MVPQEFLDAAIAEADEGGRFDAQKLSKRLHVTTRGLQVIGQSLQELQLIAAPSGEWQLIGVARELARALNGRNVDRPAPRRP
jgi:hypothetical protein